MRIKYTISFILLFICLFAFATDSSAQLKTVRFHELDSLQLIKKKPVLIFIHTDWCRYCGAMKNTAFKKNNVVQLLNERFYFVSFDAEAKEEILFNGQKFIFKPSGLNTGINELALQLGKVDGQLSFPTLCFLNSSYEIIYQHAGYLTASEVSKLLQKLSN